ncbi:hypothetical protein BKA67DRAFT_536728 [Truncatella angustata]|uniref:Tat pathway signal sequence n=1 Tax=Truncatella angustata TaxID=152316 RepID=A0A9P8ZWG8_9PEZI|nr:uncharacterized protein BKA67DRAFT_536728 [Truncatella angustata]KAH6653026.1 hypothetical protein BKA67DRAFT_536728 [Truncatella angustata]
MTGSGQRIGPLGVFPRRVTLLQLLICSFKPNTKVVAAPVLSSVQVHLTTKSGKTTLLRGPSPSIYRQEPSHEVDLAWDRIGDTRLIPLTRAEVEAIGKDPRDAVKFPESFGLGPDAYAGRLEVFHQVHCLDALRREAYFEHYYGSVYGGYNETSEMHRLHLSHCIEYLLQGILCQANTDVYTHIWTDGVDRPFPDFSVNHQCRDYDAIKSWHDQNAVDVDNFVELRAPPDAKVHRMSREFKDLHGWFETHEDTGSYGDEIA